MIQSPHPAWPFSRKLASVMVLLLFAPLWGCGTKQPKQQPVALALDGPPLAIVAELDSFPLEGTLERNSMVGYGVMELHSTNPSATLTCTSAIDAPPSDKGRVRGVLECSNNSKILFTLRNLGPDQGVGIGRSSHNNSTLILFYHPSKSEASRRFPQAKNDIVEAQKLATTR